MPKLKKVFNQRRKGGAYAKDCKCPPPRIFLIHENADSALQKNRANNDRKQRHDKWNYPIKKFWFRHQLYKAGEAQLLC